MRMVPPVRGVCAMAVAVSATPKPAATKILLNMSIPPMAQEYSRP